MADKSPYRLTIKLTSARPDAIGEALTALRERMSEYDASGETATTITIESYKEAPLTALVDDFELWLYRYKIGIACEIGLKRPGVRPETILAMRATKTTPMDNEGWEGETEDEEADEPLITPAPFVPRQLTAPVDWVEAEVIEEQQLTEEVEA